MKPSIASLLCLLGGFLPYASAVNELYSNSLNPCQTNNNFTATEFNVILTPSNNSLSFSIDGVSTITGNVTLDLNVLAYGLNVYQTTINPCTDDGLSGLCPMSEGQLQLPTSNLPIPQDALANVPGIAYTIPDLDAVVRVYFNKADTGESAACVEAELSNGKTVYQKGVGWAVAVIAGLALVASAVTSGLGHSNTAAHVAANALALFGFFQAQALIGLTAVDLPPIVASWTQNFQWSMGIIRVDFLQNIATWYQRSTGGTPSTILSSLGQTSVEVMKRSLQPALGMTKRAAFALHNYVLKRGLVTRATTTSSDTTVIVRGIQRVGFRAGIEVTNIFLTGYIFFMIFVVAVVIGVVIFKLFCELLVKLGHMKGDKFQDFRNGWTTVLKGILFRIVLIGFPQMVVLCFWEFTQDDSGAEMVLAIFTVFTMIGILAWAASKVIRLARRSIAMHKNPAYILYSDPVSLNKWGFLYVQFKATAYYFIVPVLVYLLVKGMFIAFAQSNGTLQAIALVVIEALFLILVCVMRPYMDKKTNAFNISIIVINFISAVFLLVFTGIFDAPGIVIGVMGVIFFIYNAVFAVVLLIIVIIASVVAITAKNPDTRYQPMRDDRGSFIKSQSQLTTELDALGATARGETKHGWSTHKGGARIEDDDEDAWSGSGSSAERGHGQPTAYGGAAEYQDNASSRHMPPSYASRQDQASPYEQSRTTSMTSNDRRFRQQGASPWQRGAGYE